MNDPKKEIIAADTPPYIRLFISSAFLGMEEEREYFNDVITPRVRALCRDKGVSFFSVDLRWGITQDDIKSERLIPICLSEIDECIPFFLGIIGNRYGSRISSYNEELLESYPWLCDCVGASYTELEIRHKFLTDKGRDNTLFMFKNCPPAKDPEEEKSLTALKDMIVSKAGDCVEVYSSVQEFADIVIERFALWLDRAFPEGNAHVQRELLYKREISGQSVSDAQQQTSILECIKMSRCSVMLCGDGPLGKTSCLNRIAALFPCSTVINCRADEANGDLRYVISSVCRKISGAAADDGAKDELDRLAKFADSDEIMNSADEERMKSDFCNVLSRMRCCEETLLVINDIDYITSGRAEYLQWLPVKTEGNLRIICSSSDADIVSNAQLLQWQMLTLRPMDKESSRRILTSELRKLGKNPADALPLLDSPLAVYPGFLKQAIDFLNCFGSYDTISAFSEKFSQSTTFCEFYSAVFAHIEEKHTGDILKGLKTVLCAMAVSHRPLGEEGAFAVLHYVTKLEKMHWHSVKRLMTSLVLCEGEAIPLQLKKYIFDTVSQNDMNTVHNALGEYCLSLCASEDERNKDGLRNLKCALLHFSESGNVKRIFDILERKGVFAQLVVYERDCLRGSLLSVLRNSDRNVAKVLVNKMQAAQDTDESGEVTEGIYTLYTELGLVKEQKQLEKCFLLALQNGLLQPEQQQKRLLHENMLQLAIEIAQEESLAAACEWLQDKSSNANTPVDEAFFSNIKADLFVRYRHCDVLPYIEKALSLSVRSASVYNVLYAYEMKVTVYLKSERYSEALSLAKTGLKWAQEFGYTFYYISFLNSIAVALYRTQKCDKAIAKSKVALEICERIGHIQNVAVCQKNIGIAYNVSGRYKECIAYLEERLKNKQLTTRQQLMLIDVLIGAYFNLGNYRKSYEYTKKAIKLSDSDDAVNIKYHTILALHSVSEKGSFDAKAAKELSKTLQMAYDNGNFDCLCYILGEMLPMMYKSDVGMALWDKWNSVYEEHAFDRTTQANDMSYEPGGSFMFSVHNLPRIKAETDGIVTAYEIAVKQGDYKKAASLAYKLARINETHDKNEAAKRYYDAFVNSKISGDSANAEKYASYGISLLMNGGVPNECELFYDFIKNLGKAYAEQIENWQKAAKAIKGIGTDPVAILCGIISCEGVCQTLKRLCVSDLSPLIATLSAVEIGEVCDAMTRCGIKSAALNSAVAVSFKRTHEKYNEAFGAETLKKAMENEKKLGGFINRSGCFRVTGVGLWEKLMPSGNASFTVAPEYECRYLDHVFATVNVADDNGKFTLMCITDIVFGDMTQDMISSVEKRINEDRDKNAYSLALSPNKTLKCACVQKCTQGDLKERYAAYARYALGLIRDMDDIAKG